MRGREQGVGRTRGSTAAQGSAPQQPLPLQAHVPQIGATAQLLSQPKPYLVPLHDSCGKLPHGSKQQVRVRRTWTWRLGSAASRPLTAAVASPPMGAAHHREIPCTKLLSGRKEWLLVGLGGALAKRGPRRPHKGFHARCTCVWKMVKGFQLSESAITIHSLGQNKEGTGFPSLYSGQESFRKCRGAALPSRRSRE
jgi:hypothetical protein